MAMFLGILYSSLGPVVCSSLGTRANGQITYSPDATSPHDFGTVATFTCNTGFSLRGDRMRTCGSGEVWSGSSPVCVGELLLFQCVQICSQIVC